MRDSNSLHCLLEDDPEAVRLARSRRARSLALSISLQALFIAVVVVAPLLATGKLALQTQPPIVIYKGHYTPIEVRSQGDAAPRPDSTGHTFVTTKPMQPNKIPDSMVTNLEDGPWQEPGKVPGGCPNCREDGLIPPIFGDPAKIPTVPPPVEIRPAPRPAMIRVGQPIQEAKLIHRVDPTYPPLCRQIHLEGSLVLRAIIGRDGSMRELHYVRGNACFLQYSMDALSQWRYQPTLLNGEPVEVETTITVVFKLNR